MERARAVARRALTTINFRQQDEKLNIYVAWLNLESMHGTQVGGPGGRLRSLLLRLDFHLHLGIHTRAHYHITLYLQRSAPSGYAV